jgi:D-tyrosyl-tRNA(Tyr) deacylase
MKALVQRVREASVEVGGSLRSSTGRGLLVFLGVERGDTNGDLDYLVRKVSSLRVFPDTDDRMNLSVMDIGGEVLVVSQFTLAADTRRGNRPSFVRAEEPTRAEAMYREFMQRLGDAGVRVASGEFAADMAVSLVNEGPVTIMLDSGLSRSGNPKSKDAVSPS